MNCNRISSYIRQLLHLLIKNYCLLGRLITIDINIMTIDMSVHGELRSLHYGDETILHTRFKNKKISLVDPFQTYYDKISYRENEGVDVIYTCHVIDGVETISIRHTNGSRRYRMKSRSNTWYSGIITLTEICNDLKRHDIFNCEGSIIHIIRLRESNMIICNNNGWMILDDDKSPDTLDVDDDCKRYIATCIDIIENDIKLRSHQYYITTSGIRMILSNDQLT